MQLGEMLIKEGLVTGDQVETALRVQQKLTHKKRLGRILKELKFISSKDLREFLEKNSGPNRIGDTLLERDYLTEDQLEFALLRQQQSPGMKLGEILIEENLMTQSTFCTALAYHLGIERVVPELRLIQLDLVRKTSLSFLNQNRVCPYREEGGKIQVLLDDPGKENIINTLRSIYGKPVQESLVTEEELDRILRYIEEKPEAGNLQVIETTDDVGSTAGIINNIFSRAIDLGASDIHIEPQETVTRVRYRIDGTLIEFDSFPKRKHTKLISRIKVMAGCDITEKRMHQDGKIELSHQEHHIDLRVSIFVTIQGESAVIRILNPMTNLFSLDQLGFSPRNYARYSDEIVPSASGIVLFTGPTGCGKTTSLYSTLQFQRNDGLKIVSVENPVEYIFSDMTQCAVDVKSGRDFSHSLKHIMRQDPDVIVLGEIRDRDTAEVAIHASMTGHKVYSTLHTEDSTGALIRLVQMGIEPYMVSSTVLAVVAQRLIRRICDSCSVSHVPHVKHLRRMGISPNILKSKEFTCGRGCQKCLQTGYYGRIAIHEVLILEERVRDAVLRRTSSYQLRELSIKHAELITMAEDAVYKVMNHKTTFDEVIHKIPITTPCRSYTQILNLVR